MVNYNFSFNLQDPRVYDSDMEFVSGDIGAYGVTITFLSGGMCFDISNYSFIVKVIRADKIVQTDAGDITDNKAVYVFKNSMLSVPGDVVIEFALADQQGNYVTAKIVRATVLQGSGDGNNANDNTNAYVTLLSQLTERLNQAKELLDDLNVDLSELENRPTYGGRIEELPSKNSVAGTYYIAESDIAERGIRYGGLLPDMFALDGNNNITMAYEILFTPDEKCIGPAGEGYHRDGVLAVYNVSGEFAGYIDYHPTMDTMPTYLDLTKLGVTDSGSYVEFYLGIYDSTYEFPEYLQIYKSGSLFVNNGFTNICYPPVSELLAVKESIGDIDEALDAILAQDAALLGGEA